MQESHDWSLDRFEQNGFALLKSAVSEEELVNLIESLDRARQGAAISDGAPGIRSVLRRCRAVRQFAKSPRVRSIAVAAIGGDVRPVKAILFDKTPGSNWYVTWHQDLTIAVKQQLDVPGFGPWSMKDGSPHVQPPSNVLENMVALRIHLDRCSEENGAIKFIPGSHAAGILDSSEISSWRTARESVCCAAERGDIILMRPLILHSSSQSKHPERRRVLHVEYTSRDLSDGLLWAEGGGLDGVYESDQ